MDNTTLTIIGMIAAFITASVTAFLAEPVKEYFHNKAKLHNLRVALYKEIAQNSFNIDAFLIGFDNKEKLVEILRHWVSDKCYKNIVEHSVEEYYRLEDLIIIDHVYKYINLLLLIPENPEYVLGSAEEYGTAYVEDVSSALKSGKLNQKIMKKAVGTEDLIRLLNPETTKHDSLVEEKH